MTYIADGTNKEPKWNWETQTDRSVIVYWERLIVLTFVLSIMTDYTYKNAQFENQTDKDVPKEAVFQLLFEGTSASGEPAVNFEVSNIESVSGPVETVEVNQVVVEEVEDDKIVFTVRTPSITVTVPENSTDYDTRVCHESEIPYHYYDIALLN